MDYHHRFLNYLDEDKNAIEIPTIPQIKVDYFVYSSLLRIYVNGIPTVSMEFDGTRIFLFYKKDNDSSEISVDEYRVHPAFFDAFLHSILFELCGFYGVSLGDVDYYLNDVYVDDFILVFDDSCDEEVIMLVTDTVLNALSGEDNEYNVVALNDLKLYDDYLDFMEQIEKGE